jgi:hypothetical protein
MAIDFGNYGSQLKIDDYNRALQAGGSSYQIPQQQGNSFAGYGANPYATAPTQSPPVKQAMDTEVPYMRRGAVNEGGEKKRDGASGLQKVLGIVGKIAMFL